MELSLVVLAAGVGSRYGGLKQLAPIGPGGETLLEYSVFDALRAGFERIVLVVRPQTEAQFLSAFGDGMARHVPLTYVHQTLTHLPAGCELPEERQRPWGTGQAILAAAPVVEGAFAVVNADDFYGQDSFATLSRFLRDTANTAGLGFAMMGFEIGQTLTDAGPTSRALCELDDRGRLQRIVEIAEMWKRGAGGAYRDDSGRQVEVGADELVSMNMWGFTGALFPLLEARFKRFLGQEGLSSTAEFLIPEVVQSLVDADRCQVDVLRRTGRWCGITYPADTQRARAMLAALVAAREYPASLWD